MSLGRQVCLNHALAGHELHALPGSGQQGSDDLQLIVLSKALNRELVAIPPVHCKQLCLQGIQLLPLFSLHAFLPPPGTLLECVLFYSDILRRISDQQWYSSSCIVAE